MRNEEKILEFYGFLDENHHIFEQIYDDLSKVPPFILDSLDEIIIKNNLT